MEVCHEFLEKKFSPTEREKLRTEFEALPECRDESEELTRKEYDAAVCDI